MQGEIFRFVRSSKTFLGKKQKTNKIRIEKNSKNKIKIRIKLVIAVKF